MSGQSVGSCVGVTVMGDNRSCLTAKTGGLEAGDGERTEVVVAGLPGLTV